VSRERVFISYSHADRPWLHRLQVHLRPLVREGVIDAWDDTHIQPGVAWRDEIQFALENSSVAVLLVSSDFLASDFIAASELPPLLARAERRGLLVLWVLVGPCLWKRTELANIQAALPTDQPLNAMSKADAEQALFRVAERIAEALPPGPR
jgi:hypothetical protein